jgi:(p)ppGpp synthase/HD superfamily hydrolase
MRAYRFAKNLPFPQRSSGEDYIIHLLQVVSLYLDFAPNPTIEGMIDALHHDTHEDFPAQS